VALACSEAPARHAKASARLLANRAVTMEIVESVSAGTGAAGCQESRSSRGRSGRGASRK
jgi:hypothetical protein